MQGMQIWHLSHEDALEKEMVSESHSVMSDSAAPWTIQSMELSRPEQETDTEALGVCAGAAAALVFPISTQDWFPLGLTGLISLLSRGLSRVFSSTKTWNWNSPGQNTGVGGLYLLQGIFPIQGSNPGLLHCRQILYQMSYQGSRGIRKEMATHCSILVREIPWTEELGVLQSMRSWRGRHVWVTEHSHRYVWIKFVFSC